MTTATLPSTRDSLAYLRDLGRRQNDPRGAVAAQAIDDLLDPANDNLLRRLVGEAPPPPAWYGLTTKQRRAIRDKELLLIRNRVPGLTAAQLARLIATYEGRWARRDRALETMPDTYGGTVTENLFNAFRVSADRMPGRRSLRRLLRK